MLRQVFALLLSFALLQGNLVATSQACTSLGAAHGAMAGMTAHAAGDAPTAPSAAAAVDQGACCDAPSSCDEPRGMVHCAAMLSCANATMPVRTLATAPVLAGPTEEVVGPVLSPRFRALVPELPPPRG